jgi:hypothetical protein
MNHDLIFIAIVVVYEFRGDQMNDIYNDLWKLEYLFGVGLLWYTYAGVCVGGRNDLYVCRRTMTGNMYGNDIVNNMLPQFQAAIGENFVYVDDNTRPRRTQLVLETLDLHEIQHFQLLLRSPDLNSIEYALESFWKRSGRPFALSREYSRIE